MAAPPRQRKWSFADAFAPRCAEMERGSSPILLMEIARLLTDATRDIDTVARLGGDEFAIIAPNLEGTMTVDTIAVRIIKQLSRAMTLKGCLLNTGTSIGLSECRRDDIDAEALIRMADQALYAAKTEGRGTYHYYDKAMHSAAMAQTLLEDDLRLALVREEFELYYQPQLRITGDRILRAEALVRWRHPVRGLLAPGEFIPIAESSALIVELGEWVLRQSCKQNKAWQDAGLPPLRVAVNISARQFQSDDPAATVESVLEETGLDPRWLELEITEGMMITDTETAATKLERIDDLGVQIAVDDFGTSYSSLAYLKSFPVKRLKVDQSFVRDLSTDADDAAIAEAVIRLGHSLNLEVLAEGVETQGHVDFLRAKGCDGLQGFHFSRPLPQHEFVDWVRGGGVLDGFWAAYTGEPMNGLA